MVIETEKLTNELLSHLKKERDREVLVKRFSLDGGEKATLEEIGQAHRITRERVRQIEKAAITRLQKETALLSEFESLVSKQLAKTGGLSTSSKLTRALLGSNPSDVAKKSFFFLLYIHPSFLICGEETGLEESWRLRSVEESKVKNVVRVIVELLNETRKPQTVELIAEKVGSSVSRELLLSILDAASAVITTDEGKYGLASWREINPRSIRDKTYYVLKKYGKPMHFSEIANSIKQLKFDNRSVTKQAVHNELIRDQRFVLIGRGIYALAEWGYKPGIVAEVIEEILKKAGKPMHKNEIVNEVLKIRQVREATIVLNLQNKDKFKRVAKATYTLVE